VYLSYHAFSLTVQVPLLQLRNRNVRRWYFGAISRRDIGTDCVVFFLALIRTVAADGVQIACVTSRALLKCSKVATSIIYTLPCRNFCSAESLLKVEITKACKRLSGSRGDVYYLWKWASFNISSYWGLWAKSAKHVSFLLKKMSGL